MFTQHLRGLQQSKQRVKELRKTKRRMSTSVRLMAKTEEISREVSLLCMQILPSIDSLSYNLTERELDADEITGTEL